MSRYLLLLVALIGPPCATAAAALAPREVLVVANAKSKVSTDLAQRYARLRGIPSENVALINTSKTYSIGRDSYNRQILSPLRNLLIDRGLAGKVRCVVLMWGMPVRVAGTSRRPRIPQAALYKAAADKAHYRLATDYGLLAGVARKFPPPRTEGLSPLGKLFSSPVPAPSEPLTDFEELRRRINALLARKRLEAASLQDPARKRIAMRQLMALHLDIGGLKGLISFIEMNSPPGAPDLGKLRERLDEAARKLNDLRAAAPTKANVRARLELMDQTGGAVQVVAYVREKLGSPPAPKKKQNFIARTMTSEDAAVDSELAAMWWPKYKLTGALSNPLHWRVRAKFAPEKLPTTMMTARIDGPTGAEAMRIIKASVAAEKTGLKGMFYIDAGGGKSLKPEAIRAYDVHFRKLYDFVSANAKIKAVLNEKPSVFQPNSCPRAALYVGWYSVRRYVPAFTWVPGAVGWHVASYEAQNLRDPDSQEWCAKMIQNGVAGTLGPIAEPFLRSFPLPEEFFGLLLTGKFTLAECYWRTAPTISWRMTLIGDPLYNPFKANPQIGVDILPPGLAP